MKKDIHIWFFIFFLILICISIPRTTTSIAGILDIELPVRPTGILLFPFVSFFPPLIAILCGRYFKKPWIVFTACLVAYIFGLIVDWIILGTMAHIRGWSWVEHFNISMSLDIQGWRWVGHFYLAICLGLIGAGGAFTQESKNRNIGFGLAIIGLILWFMGFTAGISRWFNWIIGQGG